MLSCVEARRGIPLQQRSGKEASGIKIYRSRIIVFVRKHPPQLSSNNYFNPKEYSIQLIISSSAIKRHTNPPKPNTTANNICIFRRLVLLERLRLARNARASATKNKK